MSAEEKAKDLVNIFRNETAKFVFIRPELSKQCALICVERERKIIIKLVSDNKLSVRYGTKYLEELYEVKQEIDKL